MACVLRGVFFIMQKIVNSFLDNKGQEQLKQKSVVYMQMREY